MRKRQDPNTYDVGYCKPPKATQFRKGQSGNPRGRRKPPKTPRDVLKQALNQKMSVRQDGVVTRMSVLELIINSLTRLAIKGETRAVAQVLRLIHELNVHGPEPGQYGVLVVPGRATPEEWAAMYGPGGTHVRPVPDDRATAVPAPDED